jgi:hypothetical protein
MKEELTKLLKDSYDQGVKDALDLDFCKYVWPEITEQEEFKPDWDAIAVMVEEQQRMAKRIEELEAMLESQEPVAVDQTTMELAESVGLIGPASRTHDLHDAIQRFHDLICANATIKAAVAFSRTLEAKDEPVAWKWHQAPVKTLWGHDMVVADLAIDKDNTMSIYCERGQTAKVEAMFTHPPQRSESSGKPSAWVGLTNNELQPIADEYRILFGSWVEDFARAIEAKLKERNT